RFSRDWSSDVCSSDLVLQWQQANSQLEAVAIIGPETLLLREKREIDTNTFGYALIAARVDNGKILRVDYNGTAPEGQLPTVDEKIGRASCRERGEITE